MKADFGKKKNKKDQSDLIHGSYERMVKERKKKLPELENAINDVLKDYDGGSICIVAIKEDENGDAEGHSLFIGGVSKLQTQIKLGMALNDASDQVKDKLVEGVGGDPGALAALLTGLVDELTDITKDMTEEK